MGETRYEATLAAPRFRAVFDRLCSWWNPRSNFPKYLLQHEQIHFDLTEIAALELGRLLHAFDAYDKMNHEELYQLYKRAQSFQQFYDQIEAMQAQNEIKQKKEKEKK